MDGSLAEALASTTHDEVTRVLFALALVLVLARLAGDVAVRLGMPPVLGELTAGIAVGNLSLLGIDALDFVAHDAVLGILAQVGIVLLLFSVGLQSELKQLLRVGASALRVAVLGVFAPFLLGALTARIFLPDAAPLVHVFIGATLCATSVGVTARVLQDLGRVDSGEGRVVLGAAVVDDALGLLVLSVVAALALQLDAGAPLDLRMAVVPSLKGALFFAAVVPVGLFLSPRLFAFASLLRGRGLLLGTALVLCFGFAALANAIGLAAIVGAFAAGVALDQAHYANLRDPHGLEELLEPLVSVFAPLFFVVVGMRVELQVLGRPEVLALGGALTAVAVVGKMVCGLGVREPDVSRWAVGLGMIPRGEVGLIFAGVGAGTLVLGRPILDAGTYSALVLMVFATTLLTPPLLARALPGPR